VPTKPRSRSSRASSRSQRCYIETGNIEQCQALPVQAQTELLKFSSFLAHHPSLSSCSCGVPMQRLGDHLLPQSSPACDCPCHLPNYVSAPSHLTASH
jgi:hypothetical protein